LLVYHSTAFKIHTEKCLLGNASTKEGCIVGLKVGPSANTRNKQE
jgi:hypothetical protein